MKDMKKFWKIAAFSFLCIAAIASCRKKEETKEYLTGELAIEFPDYVNPGFVKTYNTSDIMIVSRPDGGKVGYYVTNPLTGKRDTLVNGSGIMIHSTFSIEVPDTLATLSFTLGAYCDDAKYYGKTKVTSFKIVKPGLDEGASISNFNFEGTEGFLYDERDGKIYPYSKVGETEWMRINLAWEDKGVAFANSEAMTDVFGLYYSWEDAMEACPEGWRLPSEEDFTNLALSQGVIAEPFANVKGLAGKLMGDLYFNSEKMWEYWPKVQITDDARLSFMPVGYGISTSTDKHRFDGYLEYAAFWTSSEYAGKGVIRYIYYDKDVVYADAVSKKDIKANVRCIR